MPYTTDYTDAGLAGRQTDTVSGAVELFCGDTPHPVTISANVSAALAAAGIPAWTPVNVDHETDEITLVTGSVVPNAITVSIVRPGSPAGRAPVYKAGCFNINAIRWPDALNTDALKFAAFDEQVNSQIVIKKPYYS